MHPPDASDCTMRPAARSDLDALTAIDARCFPAGIAYPREGIASLLSARNGLTLVAERGDTIIGFAAMQLLPSFRRSPRAPGGELVTIDVLPEFRRSGIATALHQALTEWLRRCGGDRIELHVATNNTAAIQFYQRLGYRTRTRVSRYYPGGLDAWRMEKLLQ